MARMNIFQRFWKATFGNKFNIFDIILLIILVGAVYFKFANEGVEGVIVGFVDAIFFAVVIGFFVNRLLRRAKK